MENVRPPSWTGAYQRVLLRGDTRDGIDTTDHLLSRTRPRRGTDVLHSRDFSRRNTPPTAIAAVGRVTVKPGTAVDGIRAVPDNAGLGQQEAASPDGSRKAPVRLA